MKTLRSTNFNCAPLSSTPRKDPLDSFPCPALRMDVHGGIIFANNIAKDLANELDISLASLVPKSHIKNLIEARQIPSKEVIALPVTYGNGQVIQWTYKTDSTTETLVTIAADVSRLGNASPQQAYSPSIPQNIPRTTISTHRISLDFMRNIPVAVAMVDTEMNYLAMSQKWRDDFDFTPKDFLGKNHYELAYVPQILRASYHLSLQGQTTSPVEMSYIHPDTGQLEWIKSQASAWKHEDGSIGGLFLFNDVITEDKKSTTIQVHRDKSEHLQKKMETLGSVAKGIAHEINSPAQYISNNLSFLHNATADLLSLVDVYRKTLSHELTDQTIRKSIAEQENALSLPFMKSECLRAISQSQTGIEKISRISNAIKTFSQTEESCKTIIDVNKILSDAIVVSKYQWRGLARIKEDLDTTIKPVMGHGDQIGQVILILLINAIHAIEDSKRSTDGFIRIKSQGFDDHIEIQIEDNGIGIPTQTSDKIFMPFYTTKTPKRGVGQGLTTAKKIITETHGGKINYARGAQGYTIFTICLPYRLQ